MVVPAAVANELNKAGVYESNLCTQDKTHFTNDVYIPKDKVRLVLKCGKSPGDASSFETSAIDTQSLTAALKTPMDDPAFPKRSESYAMEVMEYTICHECTELDVESGRAEFRHGAIFVTQRAVIFHTPQHTLVESEGPLQFQENSNAKA